MKDTKFKTAIDEIWLDIGFYRTQKQRESYPDQRMVMEAHAWQEQHGAGFAWIWNQCRDSDSRQLLTSRMRLHILGENESSETFYPDENLTKFKRAVVHCGDLTSHVCTHVLTVDHSTQKPHVVVFEPRKDAVRKLINDFSNTPLTIITEGLWCKTSKRSSSVALDDYCDKLSDCEIPDLICAINRAEKETIQGAEKLIGKHKPRIYIGAGTRIESVYTLPAMLLGFNSSYQFRLYREYDRLMLLAY